MNILITGANGQLGSEIKDLAGQFPASRFIFTDIGELDITDIKAVDAFFNTNHISACINCAAYTAVDRAESEREKAALINCTAAGNIAAVSAKYQAKLIHISTDFIFDGRKSTPYIESDGPNPLSVYGKTKLDGEDAVMNKACDAAIIRTAWLYSSYGNNFVKTVQRLAREKGKISMIFDQVGSPTYARDLALAALNVLHSMQEGTKSVYHYSNEGVASWYDFAAAICELSGIPCEIKPIETREYPTPAARPHYSVLNKAKIKKAFGLEIPHWRESLKECLKLIPDHSGVVK